MIISKSARKVSDRIASLSSLLELETGSWKNTGTALPLKATATSRNPPTSLSDDPDGSGHQLNLALNLIVAKEFAPVCRWFTRTSARRQPRRQAHARAIPSVVRPAHLQQAARHASFDRRRLRHDHLPTNHSPRTQHEYPQASLSPVISCNPLRLDSPLYYPTTRLSPPPCSVSLLVAHVFVSPETPPISPASSLDQPKIQQPRNVRALISCLLGV